MARSGIELAMVGNSQSFLFAGPCNPSQLDVAPALGNDKKSKLLKNRNGFGTR